MLRLSKILTRCSSAGCYLFGAIAVIIYKAIHLFLIIGVM